LSPRPATKSPKRAPKVGFVSLGCPKALVDSERILTHLRAEGYEVSPTYDAARRRGRQHPAASSMPRSMNRSTRLARRSSRTGA